MFWYIVGFLALDHIVNGHKQETAPEIPELVYNTDLEIGPEQCDAFRVCVASLVPMTSGDNFGAKQRVFICHCEGMD
jgi:hypothetical protein